QAIREAVAESLLRAAVHLQVAHKDRLAINNPPPYLNSAQPGEYPRKRTGVGQAGVMIVPTSRQEVIRTLRCRGGHAASTFYLVALANRGWKGLLDTLEIELPKLEQILGGGGGIRGVV